MRTKVPAAPQEPLFAPSTPREYDRGPIADSPSELLAGVRMRFPILCFAAVVQLALVAMHPAAAADVEAGKTAFKKCSLCHTTEVGKNKVGPSLFGVVGRNPRASTATITRRR